MAGFRVGIMAPTLASRGGAGLLTRAGYLESVGCRVDSFWVADHINGLIPRSLWHPKYCGAARLVPASDGWLEPWTALGYVAARNRLARLRLGVGVTDTGRRNPAVTAHAAASLHLLTGGRAILGIGPGEREANEPYGVDWSRPVARFEEAVATIRALWDSKGQLVKRDSPFFPLRDALFDLAPYRGTWPEIWIGAHGPRMLRATGRYGDAWFPGFPQRPQDYAERLEIIRTAASDAGRDPMAVRPALQLMVVTGRTRADVDAALDSPVGKAAALNASAEVFDRHGAKHPLGEGFSGAQDLLPFTLDEPTALAHTAAVPNSVMREIVLNGTPDEVVDKVAEWRDHGVRYLVLGNASYLQPSLRKGVEALPQFAKIVRRLRKL